MISKQLLIAIVLLLALFSASESGDIKDDYETSNEIVTNPEIITSDPANEQTGIAPPKTPETFMPSEDISEDIAVSFPVDI